VRELPTGIFRTLSGFRAYQWVPAPGYPEGRMASRRFPITATIAEMQRWREEQQLLARRKHLLLAPPSATGFLADADRYLESIRTTPGYEQRRRFVQEWALVFGERPRHEITGAEIRAQRDRWLAVGPKRVHERLPNGLMQWVEKPLPLSPRSVEDRLAALADLYTVLDGPDAPNPAKAFPEIRLPRSLDGWCYVYFLQAGPLVKIGRAVDVEDRVRRLQTMHPGPLQVVAAVPAHASLETAIQNRFRHLRRNGEWYVLEPELDQFIDRLRTGANPVALLW
jgi:hypothetical protein